MSSNQPPRRTSRITPLRLAVALGLALCAACALQLAAQVVPAERAFFSAWRQAGYPGDIPSPDRIISIRDFGALGNGVANDQPAVVAALAALAGAPGVVFFPAGTYLLRAPVNLPSGAVLRGQRSQTTTLRLDFLANGINVLGSVGANPTPILSGYTIHSATLTVANATGLAAGDYVEIHQDNDAAWNASTWARFGQIGRLTGVTGNILTLESPLRNTYSAALNPTLVKLYPAQNVGIENLRIERLLAGSTATDRDNRYTLHFSRAANCWVRGVEGYNTFGGHIALVYATRISVTGCYLHHAHEYDGGGSGYGVRIEYKTGECLIENNIFQQLRHAMLLQAAANGNVLGYNYSRENYWANSPDPGSLAGDIALHGNYVYANLFEGNIVQHIWIDDSHGQNGPLNTFFRNRAETRGINATSNQTAGQNYIGNEAAKNTYTFFFISRPGDGWSPRGSNNFQHGNNTESDGLQSPGTGSLADYSYYLNNTPSLPPAAPLWWTITGAIPTVGPPHERAPAKSIPASARWFAGGTLTVGPPSLARQPVGQSVMAGDACSFGVEAHGTPEARYQWYRDGMLLPGRTGDVLDFPSCRRADAGRYTCVVSDDRGSVVSAAALLEVHDTLSFTNELTTGTVGWTSRGTTRYGWVAIAPPAPSYLAADNIQGGTEIGTFTRPLPRPVAGNFDWTVSLGSLSFSQTGAGNNFLFCGLMATNGWTSSDFAGFRISGLSPFPVVARIQDGAAGVNGTAFNLAQNTEYRVEMAYAGAARSLTVTFYRTADNVLAGTSTATMPAARLQWDSFGLGNGVGLPYASDGFHLNRLRDVSFAATLPSVGTVVIVR
jgi:hypothetical protein